MKIDQFKKWMLYGLILVGIDESVVIEKLRSRRFDWCYFCRAIWSYWSLNEGLLFDHNERKNLDGLLHLSFFQFRDL